MGTQWEAILKTPTRWSWSQTTLGNSWAQVDGEMEPGKVHAAVSKGSKTNTFWIATPPWNTTHRWARSCRWKRNSSSDQMPNWTANSWLRIVPGRSWARRRASWWKSTMQGQPLSSNWKAEQESSHSRSAGRTLPKERSTTLPKVTWAEMSLGGAGMSPCSCSSCRPRLTSSVWSSVASPKPQNQGLGTSVTLPTYCIKRRRRQWCSSQAEKLVPRRGNPPTWLRRKLIATAPQTVFMANVRGTWSKWISVKPKACTTRVSTLAISSGKAGVASKEATRTFSPQGVIRTGIQWESTQKTPTTWSPTSKTSGCVAAHSVQSKDSGLIQAAHTNGSTTTISFAGKSTPLKHSSFRALRWYRISSSATAPSWLRSNASLSQNGIRWPRRDQSLVGFGTCGGCTCSIWAWLKAMRSSRSHSILDHNSRL